MNYGIKRLGSEDDYTNRSHCNRALVRAGLDLLPEPTGVRYSAKELLTIARETDIGLAYTDWRERRARATGAVGKRRMTAAGD